VAPVIAPRVREACQRHAVAVSAMKVRFAICPALLGAARARRGAALTPRVAGQNLSRFGNNVPPRRGRHAVMEPIKSPYYEQLSSGLLAPAR
jgi:hypothetical protein